MSYILECSHIHENNIFSMSVHYLSWSWGWTWATKWCTCNTNIYNYRAANSTRIRESILAMILLTYRYENQFLSLNCAKNVSVSITFDSRKRRRICNPELHVFVVLCDIATEFWLKARTYRIICPDFKLALSTWPYWCNYMY